LDLLDLARYSSLDEADNVRWSLVRGSALEEGLIHDEDGVNWKALRNVTLSGSFRVPAGSRWSFNTVFQGGKGYKKAAGVLAGGHCALATVFRVAALRASLPTQARQHRYPIPGFILSETVNIWWGRDDLYISNPTKQGFLLAWRLEPGGVTVTVYPE
jgi:hypothetical protein